MYICIHAYAYYICTYVFMYLVCMYVRMYVSMYVYVYVFVCTYVGMQLCTYVRMDVHMCVCVFFINIQHAALHSNTTCFMVKYLHCGYIYLHLCTISSTFYRYNEFIFGFIMYYLLFFYLLIHF
jgi:hypothetical protein